MKGISVDPCKIELEWRHLTTPTEVSFLGLVGYYHKFLNDFAKIATSLIKLTWCDSNTSNLCNGSLQMDLVIILK